MPNQGKDDGAVTTEKRREVLPLLGMALKQGEQFAIAVMEQRLDSRMIGFGKLRNLHGSIPYSTRAGESEQMRSPIFTISCLQKEYPSISRTISIFLTY